MTSMHKRALFAIIVAVVLTTFVIGCGRGTVAKVNGRKITRQEFYTRLEHLQYPGMPAEAGALVLEQLINEELVLRLAEKEGVPPTESQIKERLAYIQRQPGFARQLRLAGISRDQFKEILRVQQAAFNIQTKGISIPESNVRAYYDKNKDTVFTMQEHAFVAGIFTENKATAGKAMRLLDKGVDFGTVAQQLSTDRPSAEADGRLRKAISRGDPSLPKSVQDAVLSLPKGKYTQPIDGGDGGYVIFKVLEHRNKKTQSYENARFGIWQQMMGDAGKKKTNIEQKLLKFRAGAKIDVTIDRYKEQLTPKKPEKPKGAA